MKPSPHSLISPPETLRHRQSSSFFSSFSTRATKVPVKREKHDYHQQQWIEVAARCFVHRAKYYRPISITLLVGPPSTTRHCRLYPLQFYSWENTAYTLSTERLGGEEKDQPQLFQWPINWPCSLSLSLSLSRLSLMKTKKKKFKRISRKEEKQLQRRHERGMNPKLKKRNKYIKKKECIERDKAEVRRKTTIIITTRVENLGRPISPCLFFTLLKLKTKPSLQPSHSCPFPLLCNFRIFFHFFSEE